MPRDRRRAPAPCSSACGVHGRWGRVAGARRRRLKVCRVGAGLWIRPAWPATAWLARAKANAEPIANTGPSSKDQAGVEGWRCKGSRLYGVKILMNGVRTSLRNKRSFRIKTCDARPGAAHRGPARRLPSVSPPAATFSPYPQRVGAVSRYGLRSQRRPIAGMARAHPGPKDAGGEGLHRAGLASTSPQRSASDRSSGTRLRPLHPNPNRAQRQ